MNLENVLKNHEGNNVVLKCGGTSAANILEKNSKVLEAINQIQKTIKKRSGQLILALSAPREEEREWGNTTQNLIDAISSSEKLEEVAERFYQSVDLVIDDGKKEKVKRTIKDKLQILQGLIQDLEKGDCPISAGILCDIFADFGEECMAYIFSELYEDFSYIPLFNVTTNTLYDQRRKNLEDLLTEHGKKIQQFINTKNSKSVVIPANPGKLVDGPGQIYYNQGQIEKSNEIEGAGMIGNLGRGYGDLAAVMATEENGLLLLAKASGSVMQVDPSILEDNHEYSCIPIDLIAAGSCLVGSQIQIIQPKAIQEACRKNITIMVINEKNPLSGGTLIMPSEKYSQQDNPDDLPPIMPLAKNAYKIKISFNNVNSIINVNSTMTDMLAKMATNGVDVIEQKSQSGSSGTKFELIVAGLKDVNIIKDNFQAGANDIENIEISEQKNILAILGTSKFSPFEINFLKKNINSLFDDADSFYSSAEENLFSLAFLIKEDDQSKIEEIKKIMNNYLRKSNETEKSLFFNQSEEEIKLQELNQYINGTDFNPRFFDINHIKWESLKNDNNSLTEQNVLDLYYLILMKNPKYSANLNNDKSMIKSELDFLNSKTNLEIKNNFDWSKIKDGSLSMKRAQFFQKHFEEILSKK